MIVLITGQLIEKTSTSVIVDVQGVGYEIEVPLTTLYEMPESGQTIRLHTHFVVREDAQLLFGFHDKASQQLFRMLIKINGVGPKMAIAIMSSVSANELATIVADNSVARLVKVPGVGKKTAERLIIELRDKLSVADSHGMPSSGLLGDSSISDEAQAALQGLGYKPSEAEKLVAAALKQSAFTRSQDLIKAALQQIVR
ncbi:MAG: Holliday junction branch migration protein RuvA [Gammaproteobacteria bacterium]|jgi:Holliday junction DNA helicase RuvA|nr:Holliday junction branch migration protein RuvA [Gammaproteobacteria bacterium]